MSREVGTQPDERLAKIETTLWGAWGTNGLNSQVRRHSEQIDELFARDEALRQDIDRQLDALGERMENGFGQLYRLLISLLASVVVSAVGIVVTLLLTNVAG